MTKEQLTAIHARLDAATWKEWNPQIDYVDASHGFVSGVRIITDSIRYCWPDQDDAVDAQAHAFRDLIANAPTDLRALLDEVERLTTERDAAFTLGARAMRHAASRECWAVSDEMANRDDMLSEQGTAQTCATRILALDSPEDK
jgi:hypothetical protein